MNITTYSWVPIKQSPAPHELRKNVKDIIPYNLNLNKSYIINKK